MQDRPRHETGIGARLLQVLRLRERTERQIWLVGAATGLAIGTAYAAITSGSEGFRAGAVGGLMFSCVYCFSYGLVGRRRLRKRQDSQVAIDWEDRRSRP